MSQKTMTRPEATATTTTAATPAMTNTDMPAGKMAVDKMPAVDLREKDDWWQNAVERLFDWPERLFHRIRPEQDETWVPQLFPSEWFGNMERMFEMPFRAEMGFRVEEQLMDGEYVVRADLPGIDPEHDLEITVDDGELRINAHRRSETKEEGKGRYRSEVRYGSFTRVMPAPKGLKDKDVKATYKDGVLEVRVPAPEPDAPRKASRVKVTRA